MKNMSLDEMLNNGATLEQIMEEARKRTKAKSEAEAAAKAREQELINARRQFKKAYAKYMGAIMGVEVTEEDMQDFVNEVMMPIERAWNSISPNKRRVTVSKNADADELAATIMSALRGVI